MIRFGVLLAVALAALATPAQAATFLFNSDPFAQDELFINFDIENDVFAFDQNIFGVSEVRFANTLTENLPGSGPNVIVVQDTADPFLAGIAQDRIADRLTDPGPGFFIYFNTNLQLARFVFVTDLSDPAAQFKVLARMENISGAEGFASLPDFTAANFQPVPEPSTLLTTGLGGLFACGWALWRRRVRG